MLIACLGPAVFGVGFSEADLKCVCVCVCVWIKDRVDRLGWVELN